MIPLVKTNYFSQLDSAVAVLKGYLKFVIYKCWRTFDVILRLTSAILDHIQKRKIMDVNGKSALNGFNLGLGSDQAALKSQVSISRNSPCFSLYTFVRMFLSCSMIMTFPSLLKSWSCLLKCLQAGIALGILTSFLWLLSLMLKGVPDLPRMYPSIETHLAVVRGLPTRKFQTECVNEKSSTERRS